MRFEYERDPKVMPWDILILLVLLAIISHKRTGHTKILYDGRMFFLLSSIEKILCERTQKELTENSHSTKLLVSLSVMSVVLRNPSPIFPPLPSLRPDLSFFFFAVRTLLKWISLLEGNCRAGRWNERPSCLD